MTRIAAARSIEEQDVNPRAVIGSNRPPIHELARIDFDEAIDAHKGICQRITDLVGSASRAAATDDETMARCAELVRQCAAVRKVVDEERTTVKRPYLEAGRQIDDAAKGLVSRLVEAEDSVRCIGNTYMRDKQRKLDDERRAREAEERRIRDENEARRRAEEARAAEENRAPEPVEEIAPPPPPTAAPEPARVRSDFGAVASARKVKVATVTDWLKAFKAVKSVPAVQEAIQKAVNGLVRAGQTNIPGVEIGEDVSMSVR